MAVFAIIALGILFYAPFMLLWKLRQISRSPLNAIPGPPSTSLIKGHIGEFFGPNSEKFRKDIMEKYGRVVKFRGLFNVPQLYVFDAAALHTILIKEHHIFEEPDTHLVGNGLMFGPGLVAVTGERHKRQRKLLNPAFSPAQLRQTLPTMYQVTYQLRDAIASRLGDGWSEVDMLTWISRASLELIGQAGLGCSLDSLKDDKTSAYGEALKSLIPALVPVALGRRLLPRLVKIGSPQFWRRIVELVPFQSVRKLRDIIDMMDRTARRIVAERKEALHCGEDTIMQQIGEGKDILSRLLRVNEESSEGETISDEEIVGQVSTLVFAATDTTSSAVSRMLHLLAQHKDVQERLREEIVEARREHGDLSFDDLFELPYLEAVCRETLRLYAPVSFLSKTARQDTILPLQTPLRGVRGQDIHEVLVPKGTNVMVGIAAVNRDKALWGEDALEWKPDRWLSPLPESVAQAHIPGVYSNMMTFLGGGRACIGFKFSQCEMKVLLSVLLETFSFELSDTPIHWNLQSVQYPYAGPGEKARMPMKVKRIS
ncbi:cytochrome P450 [Ganoderma leucocontextum]|nr:cytochrome P450 [Ganoderma leucocontextum]